MNANGLRLCVRAGLVAQKFIKSRKLNIRKKSQTRHGTPPDAKPLLAAGPILL